MKFIRIERMKIWKVSCVPSRTQGMNSTIEIMNEEGDDRYKQIVERISNMKKKFSMRDERSEIKADESSKVHEDQNHGKAEATGFHGDSSEQEVEQLLRETMREIGMSTDNAKIKRTTHDIIYFNDTNERNKYVRSANMLWKEMRGRETKISRSMDAEERFHPKRLGYIKCCIYTRHCTPLNSISLNWLSTYVSVNGQIVVRTCQSGPLKYHKYQDIESEFEEQMEKWLAKNSS